MSQYPQHPQQLNYTQMTPSRGFAGERLVGILMILMSLVVGLFGGCIGAMLFNWDNMPDSPQKQQLSDQFSQLGVSMNVVATILLVLLGIYFLTYIVLGILLVMRKRFAIYVALVVNTLVCIYFVSNTVLTLLAGNMPAVVFGLFLVLIHVVLIILLIAALKAPRPMPAPMQAYYPGYYPMQYSQPMQGYYQYPQQQAPQSPPPPPNPGNQQTPPGT